MIDHRYNIKKKNYDQLVGTSFLLDDLMWNFQTSSFSIEDKKYYYHDVQQLEFQYAMIMNTKIFTLTFIFKDDHQQVMKLNLCQEMTLHFKIQNSMYIAKDPDNRILYAVMDFLLKRVQSNQPDTVIVVGHSTLYKAGVLLFTLILPIIIFVLPQVNLVSFEEWKILLLIFASIYLSYNYMNLKPKALKVSHFNVYDYTLNNHS